MFEATLSVVGMESAKAPKIPIKTSLQGKKGERVEINCYISASMKIQRPQNRPLRDVSRAGNAFLFVSMRIARLLLKSSN
jgi:hypothetical protein